MFEDQVLYDAIPGALSAVFGHWRCGSVASIGGLSMHSDVKSERFQLSPRRLAGDGNKVIRMPRQEYSGGKCVNLALPLDDIDSFIMLSYDACQ